MSVRLYRHFRKYSGARNSHGKVSGRGGTYSSHSPFMKLGKQPWVRRVQYRAKLSTLFMDRSEWHQYLHCTLKLIPTSVGKEPLWILTLQPSWGNSKLLPYAPLPWSGVAKWFYSGVVALPPYQLRQRLRPPPIRIPAVFWGGPNTRGYHLRLTWPPGAHYTATKSGRGFLAKSLAADFNSLKLSARPLLINPEPHNALP